MKIYTILQHEKSGCSAEICGSFSSGELAIQYVLNEIKPKVFGFTFEIVESNLDSGDVDHWEYIQV